jgi:hypothetical protein
MDHFNSYTDDSQVLSNLCLEAAYAVRLKMVETVFLNGVCCPEEKEQSPMHELAATSLSCADRTK